MNAYTMEDVIVPKSDQWNADDFITGPRTFTIDDVQIRGGQEQPVNIVLRGTEKFFRPCKSMSRVLVQAWGPDAKLYIGRSLTLYRDPTVKWGGMEVGGIRISHMTDIDGKKVMQLTATKGQRKPHIVMPLVDVPASQSDPATEAADKIIANIGRAPDLAKLDSYIAGKPAVIIADLQNDRPDLAAKVEAALAARRVALAPADAADDDPFADAPPAWHTEVADLRAQIAAAKTGPALEKAQARFDRHRDALPEDVIAEIDAALVSRRSEIGAE